MIHLRISELSDFVAWLVTTGVWIRPWQTQRIVEGYLLDSDDDNEDDDEDYDGNEDDKDDDQDGADAD